MPVPSDLDSFGQRIRFADGLQGLYSYPCHLQRDSAGMARHVDTRFPRGIDWATEWVWHISVGPIPEKWMTPSLIESSIRILTLPFMPEIFGKVGECFSSPQTVSSLPKRAKNTLCSRTRDRRRQDVNMRLSMGILPEVAAIPACVPHGIYIRLRSNNPARLGLSPTQDRVNHGCG